MTISQKVNYKNYPIVKVRISSAKSSHLIVRLEDGSRGIIPRREWNWDRREKPDTSKWVEGSSHEAVLMPEAANAGYSLLSFREKTDPWLGSEDLLQEGKIILGEVVNFLHDGIFIQIRPGIDAFCAAADIPLLPEQLPIDVLCYGDRVRVKINKIDRIERKLNVSINDWLRQIEIKPEEQQRRLERLFGKKMNEILAAKKAQPVLLEPQEDAEFEVPILKQVKSVMIVDDHEEDQANIRLALRPLNVIITEARSGKATLNWLEEGHQADLIIMDINLGDDTFGPEIAAKILEQYPNQHFLFTSRDPHNLLSFKFLEDKYHRKYPFFVKIQVAQSELLVETIRLLQTGIVHKTKSMVARNQDTFVEQLEMQAYLKSSLKTGLEVMLADLRRSTFVQHAFILEYDEPQRAFEVVASHPNNRPEVYAYDLEKLYYSPAREVIEEDEVLYVSEINGEIKTGRFRNFYSHLNFSVCYGVPIKLPGYATRFGLFVLNSTTDLTWETILHIRTMANFCSVLIERDFILRKMQVYEDRYFKGQLFGTLMHELGNYMMGLKTNIDNAYHFGLKKPDQEKLARVIDGLANNYKDMDELNASHTRLMKDEIEYIDINDIVKKVKRQLGYKAKEESNTEIVLDLQEDMPNVKSNPLRIEQVISNLVLNAIQHVAIQFKQVNNINNIQGYEQSLLVTKTVLIKTCFHEDNGLCHIFILDTGPGVPYEQQHKIFRAGESSRREGQGLGLFISKNLTEAMQGNIVIADSIRFGGSLFAISLPIGSSKK
jgi:signal transduction histidine kinase/DNA-binding NarL/FixJ family response regulator/predicted RNA-binding protein with RPS1 domain